MSINCPSCQGQRIHRSKTKGVLESGLLAMIFVRPFRCEKCDYRFFRWKQNRERDLSRVLSGRECV